MTVKVLDLFCGAGGFSNGFERVGYDVIAGVDVNEDAVATFEANHDGRGIEHDLTNTTPAAFARKYDIEPSDVDVVIGGPPCQGFSTVNKDRSVDDERNNLVHVFAEYVAYYDPSRFYMENVTGITNVDDGELFADLLERFETQGYTVEWEAMNATHYGVPQRRTRIIVQGVRDGEPRWPVRSHVSEEGSRYRTVRDAIGDLASLKAGERGDVDDHVAVDHGESVLSIIRRVPEGGGPRDIDDEFRENHSTNLFDLGGVYCRLSWDEPATTLTGNFTQAGGGRYTHPSDDRTITPREGARIQTFDDSFTFEGAKSSRVQQIGNAVPPLLAEKLAEVWQ